jgi:hypothetical protein
MLLGEAGVTLSDPKPWLLVHCLSQKLKRREGNWRCTAPEAVKIHEGQSRFRELVGILVALRSESAAELK